MPETLEAEVIEIDGKPPEPAPSGPGPESAGESDPFRRFGGRVLRFDRRWWPLWVALGVIAGVLLLAIGLVGGVLYVLFATVRGVLRALLGGWIDTSSGDMKRR